jgi:hypothetical protein
MPRKEYRSVGLQEDVYKDLEQVLILESAAAHKRLTFSELVALLLERNRSGVPA